MNFIETSVEIEHEEIVFDQMKEELLNLVKLQKQNEDWLHGLTVVENIKSHGTLDMLSKLCQLQFNPEEHLSESTFLFSETRKAEKDLMVNIEMKKLTLQIKELKERREKVKKLIESVTVSSENMKLVSEKRKNILGDHKSKHQGSNSEDDASDLQRNLQDKYAPDIFDEKKAKRGLDKLDSLEKERASLMNRLKTQSGKFSLPTIPIPPNIYIAQDEFKKRQAYLVELMEKVENRICRN